MLVKLTKLGCNGIIISNLRNEGETPSLPIKTSLGLLPLAGPITPLSSSKSTILAARLYPNLNLLCNKEAETFLDSIAKSTLEQF